jgi:hypothetical protein
MRGRELVQDVDVEFVPGNDAHSVVLIGPVDVQPFVHGPRRKLLLR